MFERSTATAIGVQARNSEAKRPAAVPNTRRTRWYSTRIDAKPSRACGSKTLDALKPKSSALRVWAQKATGGLSSDTKPAGWNALKKKLCQLTVMLRAPAI